MVANHPQKKRIITDQEAENISRVEELAYEIKVSEVMTNNLFCFSPDGKMAAGLNNYVTGQFFFSTNLISLHLYFLN